MERTRGSESITNRDSQPAAIAAGTEEATAHYYQPLAVRSYFAVALTACSDRAGRGEQRAEQQQTSESPVRSTEVGGEPHTVGLVPPERPREFGRLRIVEAVQ